MKIVVSIALLNKLIFFTYFGALQCETCFALFLVHEMLMKNGYVFGLWKF